MRQLESDALRALSMALTTGEHSAAKALDRFLADGVTMVCGSQNYSGRPDVLATAAQQAAA